MAEWQRSTPTAYASEVSGFFESRWLSVAGEHYIDIGHQQCASAAVSLRRLRSVLSIIFIGMGGNHAHLDIRFDNIGVTRRRMAE